MNIRIRLLYTSTLLLFLVSFNVSAQFNDTSKVDVLHYSISLDSINISSGFIKGSCQVSYLIQKQTNSSYFMLKSLQIDSIVSKTATIKGYAYNGSDITLNYINPMQPGIKDSFTVFYHGNPVSGAWGGFYFSQADGGYAYNMGISMNDYPHAYGRCWFPCVDLFSDRATYKVKARTAANMVAMSGGLLTSKIINKDSSITWLWEAQKPVATDLISIAVGPYTIFQKQLSGAKRKIPAVFGVKPADTSKLLASFQHLEDALAIFEQRFGEYRFDKVGYSMVPFSGGAMEHSENITYPVFAVDGKTNYETLWAHELSHNWWGNLLKCYTSDDMWLNEGWAAYSEQIFIEGLYGRQAYLNNIRSLQKYVLQYAHINDESALALSPLPTDFTYGTTAYKKGSAVVHTLRTYMGDSLFFAACKRYLNSLAFKNHNSAMLRDSFSKYSGINLNVFFDEWVFRPGFPHFEIYKTSYNQTNSEYTISIRQQSRFNSSLYSQVPLKVSFYNSNFERIDQVIIVNGFDSDYIIKTPWQASLIVLNIDADIAEAISKNYSELNTATTYTFDEAMMTVKVNSLPSPAFIVVEHHWIGPDHELKQTSGIRFSDYRYWSVDGIFPDGFAAEATIRYNGTEGIEDGLNYLDHTLDIKNEDSLVLLYRPDKLSPWINIKNTNATFSTFSKTDKKGTIKILDLKKGDYCLGKMDYTASLASGYTDLKVNVYPNPAKNELIVDLKNFGIKEVNIRLIDSSGKVVFVKKVKSTEVFKLQTNNYKKGVYMLEIRESNNVHNEKVIID